MTRGKPKRNLVEVRCDNCQVLVGWAVVDPDFETYCQTCALKQFYQVA